MEELPAAGLRGTKLVKQLDIPSERQLEKAAAEAAKKWVQGQSGDLAEKEVDKVEGKPPLELLGCFKDSKDRDLPRMMKSGSKDSCKAQCKDYKYFGRQWTKECWCGNSYGKHGKAEGCDCDSQTNMGGWKNCVYPTKRGEAIQLPEKPPPKKPQPKPKPKPKPKPASKPACKHIISNSKVKYSVEPGVNLRGPGGNEDVRKVHTANVAACSAKCDAEPKCQYFVFIAG